MVLTHSIDQFICDDVSVISTCHYGYVNSKTAVVYSTLQMHAGWHAGNPVDGFERPFKNELRTVKNFKERWQNSQTWFVSLASLQNQDMQVIKTDIVL